MKLSGCSYCSLQLLRKPGLSMRLSRKHKLSMKLSRKPKLSIKVSWWPIFYNVAFGYEKKVRPEGPAKTRHVFVKHGCPRGQQRQNMAKISKSYILTPPQGQVMSEKCEEHVDELTVQVWLLYHHPNFKYCTLFVSGTELQTNGQTNRQTNEQMDDPITRCPLSDRGHKNGIAPKKFRPGPKTQAPSPLLNIKGTMPNKEKNEEIWLSPMAKALYQPEHSISGQGLHFYPAPTPWGIRRQSRLNIP